MKVAIVGSRDYPKLDDVRRYIDGLDPDDAVLTGDAHGVDRTVFNYCTAKGRKVTIFPVDRIGLPEYAGPYGTEESRREFGRRAYARNGRLVAAADRVVAFAISCQRKDCSRGLGQHLSHGTDNAIGWAKIHGKPCAVKLR